MREKEFPPEHSKVRLAPIEMRFSSAVGVTTFRCANCQCIVHVRPQRFWYCGMEITKDMKR